jgi:hypothetical protein
VRLLGVGNLVLGLMVSQILNEQEERCAIRVTHGEAIGLRLIDHVLIFLRHSRLNAICCRLSEQFFFFISAGLTNHITGTYRACNISESMWQSPESSDNEGP